MRYIWELGKNHRVMHISKFTSTGEMLFQSLCGIDHKFNRSINAPWALGRKVCKKCERRS